MRNMETFFVNNVLLLGNILTRNEIYGKIKKNQESDLGGKLYVGI